MKGVARRIALFLVAGIAALAAYSGSISAAHADACGSVIAGGSLEAYDGRFGGYDADGHCHARGGTESSNRSIAINSEADCRRLTGSLFILFERDGGQNFNDCVYREPDAASTRSSAGSSDSDTFSDDTPVPDETCETVDARGQSHTYNQGDTCRCPPGSEKGTLALAGRDGSSHFTCYPLKQAAQPALPPKPPQPSPAVQRCDNALAQYNAYVKSPAPPELRRFVNNGLLSIMADMGGKLDAPEKACGDATVYRAWWKKRNDLFRTALTQCQGIQTLNNSKGKPYTVQSLDAEIKKMAADDDDTAARICRVAAAQTGKAVAAPPPADDTPGKTAGGNDKSPGNADASSCVTVKRLSDPTYYRFTNQCPFRVDYVYITKDVDRSLGAAVASLGAAPSTESNTAYSYFGYEPTIGYACAAGGPQCLQHKPKDVAVDYNVRREKQDQ